ncbi:MAG: prolipoprotein diacylglyceryl transferase [Dehalococcoidales bacterium]|jgi:phosphatidylglycerol:prolipoprotein diacylglycerol transferase
MIEISINPIAFSIGPIDVGWYGIMVTLAVITMVVWALLNARKDPKITYDMVINGALVGIPSGAIFARLLHVIDKWSYYYHNPGEIIGGDGLTIWGAVLGVALGLWIFSRFNKRSFAYLADMLAPGIILAQAVGRVGCTILGDDTGTFTSLPWGVVYTNMNSPSFGLPPTHPVVTYEIIYNLIAFGVLFLLRKKLKPDGSLFMVYLALYSAWRLGGDFMRTGSTFLFGLHQAQVISIIVLLVTVPMLIWKTRWVKDGEHEEAAPEEKPAA